MREPPARCLSRLFTLRWLSRKFAWHEGKKNHASNITRLQGNMRKYWPFASQSTQYLLSSSRSICVSKVWHLSCICFARSFSTRDVIFATAFEHFFHLPDTLYGGTTILHLTPLQKRDESIWQIWRVCRCCCVLLRVRAHCRRNSEVDRNTPIISDDAVCLLDDSKNYIWKMPNNV